MGNPLCHFEFMVSDVDKSKEFYGKVFDWEFQTDDAMGYTMINTGTEPGGGMMKKPDQAPMFALSQYFQVDDIDVTLRRIEEAGGKPVMPRTVGPEFGAAHILVFTKFVDPAGNVVGLVETPK